MTTWVQSQCMYFWPKASSISRKANHKLKLTKFLNESPFSRRKMKMSRWYRDNWSPAFPREDVIQAGLYDEPAALSEKRHLKTFY